MSYTPMSDLGQQGLFDITRTLLQHPDLKELASSLTQLVKQNSLADRVNILLYHSRHRRVSFYGKDKHGKELQYEDEMVVLANGPVRRMLSRPEALICSQQEFDETWPQIASLDLYAPFGRYSLLPLASEGKIFGGCEFIRDKADDWTEKELNRLCTLAQIVGLVTEQIQTRLNASHDHQLLCRERDNFRILVAVTNAVLSKLSLDELISEIAREIHNHFAIDSICVVLKSSHRSRLTFYSTHFVDEGMPFYDQSDMVETGTLSERVIKSGEMLLLNICSDDKLAQYERMLLEMWDNKPQMLCLQPLKFGNNTLGVLKLAKCSEQGFTPDNLKLLRQIAERIAIAVDNALAYQEINLLKENLVDENLYLTEQINNVGSDFCEIIGRGKAMSIVLKQVEMVASSDSTVLILGETGTGKELIARAIHSLSERNSRRMVKINCAAMPAALLESELFGHERGAFTGANNQRIGRFELADKSSLFLDEVGDMPLELQPKLLRVLQEKEFERLGSNKVQEVDVRLIAATNRNLKEMVANREFRSDLYYRLNVFPISLPPLRKRPEDIPLLVKYFTFKIARRLNRHIDSIPAETLRALSRMEWPGNVRELQNVIERAILLTRGNVLCLSLSEMDQRPFIAHNCVSADLNELHEDEYHRIVQALRVTNGVIAGPRGAAQRLGLKRTTLLSRMKRLGIDKKIL